MNNMKLSQESGHNLPGMLGLQNMIGSETGLRTILELIKHK